MKTDWRKLEDKVEITDNEIEAMGQSQMKRWICHEISRMLKVSSEKLIHVKCVVLSTAVFTFMYSQLKRTGPQATAL